MANPIIPKTNGTAGSSNAPTSSNLQVAEIASNAFLGRLYLKTEGGSVKSFKATEDTSAADIGAIDSSVIGQANGVAPLDANGLVDATYLPSYVDDVFEFADLASFPEEGESGKIYVAIDSSISYRWSGSIYVPIVSGGRPSGVADGDLSGSYPSPTVAKIQGVDVSSTAPSSNQILKYDGSAWAPAAEISAADVLGGLTGDIGPEFSGSTNVRVVGLYGTPVDATAPGNGQVLKFNGTSWAPAEDTDTGLTELTGDVTVSGSGSQAATVVALQNTPIGVAALEDKMVLRYDAATSAWQPSHHNFLTGLQGDVSTDVESGYANATVTKIQGTSVSNAAPTAGQVLKFDGSAWAPAEDVDTGMTALTGDVEASGSGSQSTTLKYIRGTYINETTPAQGTALVVNQYNAYEPTEVLVAGATISGGTY